MLKFSIMSRSAASRYSYKTAIPKTIIISITDVDSMSNKFARNPQILAVLPLSFDDVEANEPNHISKEDGKRIIEFVNYWLDKIDQIVVHCEAGISRSAGVCAALMLILNGDDWEVFNNGKYRPNMTCYRTVLTAYFGTYDEPVANEKITQNIVRWRKSNDLD